MNRRDILKTLAAAVTIKTAPNLSPSKPKPEMWPPGGDGLEPDGEEYAGLSFSCSPAPDEWIDDDDSEGQQ